MLSEHMSLEQMYVEQKMNKCFRTKFFKTNVL
jgi:hypothetical protein